MTMKGWAYPGVTKVILRASRVIAGKDADLVENAAVVIEGSKISAIVPSAGLQEAVGPQTVDVNLGDMTLLPGLIDTHTHLMLGHGTEGRTLPEIMEHDSDDLMLARAFRNALTHLAVGVTTLRDCGSRGKTAISARDAIERHVIGGPRVLACGRAITITGGHLWFCDGEADGVEGIRNLARQLLKEGADFIKVMASGGSSTPSTNWKHYSYTAEELAAMVGEAHRVGKVTAAHCHSKTSIRNAIAAGIDSIEHCSFVDDVTGERSYDAEAVAAMARKGIYASPCIQTNWRRYQDLKSREQDLTPAQRTQMETIFAGTAIRMRNLRRLHEAGVKVVAGTDSMEMFGDFALGLKMMTDAGFTNREALLSATSEAARAIGIEGLTGSLVPGLEADIIACAGNPLNDISALDRPVLVIRGGFPFIVPGTLRDATAAAADPLAGVLW